MRGYRKEILHHHMIASFRCSCFTRLVLASGFDGFLQLQHAYCIKTFLRWLIPCIKRKIKLVQQRRIKIRHFLGKDPKSFCAVAATVIFSLGFCWWAWLMVWRSLGAILAGQAPYWWSIPRCKCCLCSNTTLGV